MTQEEAQKRLRELGRPLSDAEIIGLAALINAQATEVTAANMDRQSNGLAMAYSYFACDSWTMLEEAFRNRGLLP